MPLVAFLLLVVRPGAPSSDRVPAFARCGVLFGHCCLAPLPLPHSPTRGRGVGGLSKPQLTGSVVHLYAAGPQAATTQKTNKYSI